MSEHELVNGEPVYEVSKSYDGKKGQIVYDSQDIGRRVFVSCAAQGTTIKTTIRGYDKCHGCGSSHLGVIELSQHWIGKKVYVKTFQVFSTVI